MAHKGAGLVIRGSKKKEKNIFNKKGLTPVKKAKLKKSKGLKRKGKSSGAKKEEVGIAFGGGDSTRPRPKGLGGAGLAAGSNSHRF